MRLITKERETEFHTYRKRANILVGARLKEIGRTISATAVQDRIRKKVGRWQGAAEIKKWRMGH